MSRLYIFLITVFLFSAITVFSQPLSQNAEERILSFCQLYSTVKYYYPEPNLQNFPWDAFAYRGYEMAITAKNDKEFIKKIESLFQTIAPGVQISKKEFNLARIRPKDTSLYPERAFWQHQNGLSVEKPGFKNASTLNYIYKKATNVHAMLYTLPSGKLKLQGKAMRISLWAKVEEQKDSVVICSYKFINRKTKEGTFILIKAAGYEWTHYEKEFDITEDAFSFDIIHLYHPKKGTIYVDNLKLEVKNGENWEEIEIRNANFEGYTPLGILGGWETMYVLAPLAVANSKNAIEGKYCLKLPVVQDRLLYPPAPINQPHIVSLPMGYKAYIPLQLYADEENVFPVSDKEKIKHFVKTALQNSLTVKQRAIACAMQTWAALYHDYPYREVGFKNKLSRLLFQTISKLNITKSADFYSILANDFLLWVNDPHLHLEGIKFLREDTIGKKIINIPVKYPDPLCLTEAQCVINNVLDSITGLQTGDVILAINGIAIDSLLQLYRRHNISRTIQERAIERLLTSYGESELKVRLLRNSDTVNVVFYTDTRPKGINLMSLGKEKREKDKVLQDSLKEAGLFYLNALYPPTAFNRNIARSIESALNQYRTTATDSLIKELNQYKALILDVRGRPSSNILLYFNECMGIDLNTSALILKTAFFPIAQFKRDTIAGVMGKERKNMLIRVPVYVLIDYNTVSAPEMQLLTLKKTGRASFVGSNTAGAAGMVGKTKITDNITLVYTAGQTLGLDDNPMSYQGTGIAPDIYVYPTPQGIAEGRDEVLEKAIEIALKNIINNEQ